MKEPKKPSWNNVFLFAPFKDNKIHYDYLVKNYVDPAILGTWYALSLLAKNKEHVNMEVLKRLFVTGNVRTRHLIHELENKKLLLRIEIRKQGKAAYFYFVCSDPVTWTALKGYLQDKTITENTNILELYQNFKQEFLCTADVDMVLPQSEDDYEYKGRKIYSQDEETINV